ncbi:Bacitracin export permease protein BceB [compost metagenome]
MDYLIYFVTLTLSVSFFYAFSSLSSRWYELTTNDKNNLENFYTYINYATYLISGILIFLVYQVNKYMIKRRKREFATYILLGIEQRKVAVMFFIETLIMLLCSVVMGIFLGSLITQALTVLILTTIDSNIVFGFRFYPDTILSTFIFFLTIIVFIGLFNMKHLSKIKLIDMFNDEKKTEIQFVRGKWFYVVIAMVSLACFVFAFINLERYIEIQHLLTVDVSIKNQILLQTIVAGVLGTYALFYSFAYIMILIKDKLIRLKYKHTNLFLLGSVLSKMNTTSMMMATVTLTLLGSVICFVISPILSEWAKGYLAYRSVFDVQINNVYNSISEKGDLPQIDYAEVYKYINDSEFNVKEYVSVEMYFLSEEDFYKRRKTNFPALAISLSDFNQLRKMAGYEPISIEEDEFAMQWDEKIPDRDIRKFIEDNPSIQTDIQSLQTNVNQYYTETLGETVFNDYSDYTIVLPDKACKKLLIANINFYANTTKELNYSFASTIDPFVESWFKEEYSILYMKYQDDPEFKDFVSTRTKTEQMNDGSTSSLLIRVIGLYGGTILLIICLTLLALQQLSDSLEHRTRYDILQKLGVDRKAMNGLIIKQIGIYFSIPFITALFAFSIFLYQFSINKANEIKAYVGTKLFVFNILITLIMIVGIYLCYFASTIISFKRNLRTK